MSNKGEGRKARVLARLGKPWLGGTCASWRRALSQANPGVDLAHWPDAALTWLTTSGNSLRALGVRRRLDPSIHAVALQADPVFLIGHWRSGTTHLHNLVSRDPQFIYPRSRQCMMPTTAATGAPLFSRIADIFVPKKRPMDEMAFSPDAPQEDEFGLCNLGQPSPYWQVAFPNSPDPFPESLDLDGMSSDDLESWKQTFLYFLKAVSYGREGRLLLKSPTHTCRLPVLTEMFPQSVFIHIVRSPFAVIPSTLRLWRRMYPIVGYQTPTFEGLEDQVFAKYLHVMKRVEATRDRVPEGRFCQLRYEDLVADPIGKLRDVYRQMGFEGVETFENALKPYLEGIADYRATRWNLSKALHQRITAECADILQRYRFETPSVQD